MERRRAFSTTRPFVVTVTWLPLLHDRSRGYCEKHLRGYRVRGYREEHLRGYRVRGYRASVATNSTMGSPWALLRISSMGEMNLEKTDL